MKLRNKIGQFKNKEIFKRHYKLSPKVIYVVIVFYALIGLGTVTMTLKNESTKFFNQAKAKTIVIQGSEPVISEEPSGDTADDVEDTEIFTAEVSAYTSSVAETDSSPYITADGTNLKKVYECVIATNDYDFGTRIAIEGLGVCEVHDRMNSRYTGLGKIDVYMGNDRVRALEFGRRTLNYLVLE